MTYLDTASSAPLHPAAAEVLLAAAQRGYADPRRRHDDAHRARLLLNNARASVAESLHLRPSEITFVPSGTHACQLGMLGLRPKTTSSLAVSTVEHQAVINAAQWHAANGGDVAYLPVDRYGVADLTSIPAQAQVVALQSANHEVGSRQHVDRLRDYTDAAIFVDACASGGRDPLPTQWDTMALSPHKWGGPAGVGILLVRHGTSWRNPFPHDDRLDERTVGFENVAGALAAAAALRAVVDDDTVHSQHHHWIARIRQAVADLPDIEVVGDADDRLPHLVTFSCLYLDGESLVSELNRYGIAVASGSACASTSMTPSRVLTAMGVLTHGNVRVSLDWATTEADIEHLLAILPPVIADLRRDL